ncbi:dynein beta chain, ciliary [Tribolium castaneum]|uniref:Dynein heavy chain, cytoplasmic-like Protein n=1 Tax=Tribolium castaneum TaxID=7070 RepID=D6W7L1_TRICA|nr:PREDICTED: dynein beta chain, ciliary isoform X1 [Tribolium castaneum]EFA11309.2 Dynein heavy chain, cytoplasmic-like Protein [Tribolium castaneum]|eukprot:XP_008199382.2 PREDICTED: dynein beta chain, ciliary isoform X1 [Tribolium castaneum]
MDQPPVQVDNRMTFLGSFVQKTLKLKPEKWSRMMATEDHKAVVMKFLERPQPTLLVVVLTPTAQLVASNGFPLAQLKSKGVYFIKKAPVPVSKTTPSESVIAGDLSAKIIDQLASLVDEILVPLLSNSKNHEKWPPVIAKDVQKHVHSLKSTVYQVKGHVNGQTVLPMPVGIDKVHEVEKALIESNGEICDLYLKSAIEGVVIKWAAQINDVLVNDSSEKAGLGQNPVPSVELQFWNLRLQNLHYIYEQLREPRVKSMAVILEKTNSAYYSCFKNLFKNIVISLAEAKDICLYLKPLKKHIALVEETDFSECIPVLAPLMHVVCLIWSNSKYYDQVKIIVLLKQICNLLIQEAKKCLDPTTLFHSDIDEAMQRVGLCIKTLKQFSKIFNSYKNNLGRFFKDREPKLWNFHPNMVFERFNAFLERLQTIQWFFNTVLEFTKLEKVEIGGIKGKNLSARVTVVFGEFQQCFSIFSGKSYDVLDPDDSSFIYDFENFKQKIFEMDMKLAAIFCQAFEDCSNLESIFKLISIVGSVLERPLIKTEFTNKYTKILDMLQQEINTAEALFQEQMLHKEKHGQFILDKYMPPVAGSLRWTLNLCTRLASPLESFKSLQHPITESSEAAEILDRFDHLFKKIDNFNDQVFKEWARVVPQQIETNLKLCLLKRNSKTRELHLNFNSELSAILREIHYLKLMGHEDLPEIAIKLAERNDVFRKYISNLNSTIAWYNKIRRTTKDVEFNLIENEIAEIDELIIQGQNTLNWNSEGLWEYMTKLYNLVGNLQQNLQKCQENLNQIKNVLMPFARQPLFERKEGKKYAVLCIEEREERIAKRYSDIKKAADQITVLLLENMQFFQMTEKQDSPKWLSYIDFVDKIVMSYLYQCVGCSLGYINEHMDPTNNLAPLFEAQLILAEPNIIFVPSLDANAEDGFKKLITGLIDDISKISSIVPRFSKTIQTSYQEEITSNQDISDIKADILQNVDQVIEEAYEFCDKFQTYSYIWLDDRKIYLEHFLTYSRQLTGEEIDWVNLKDSAAPKPNPPKMEQFREQIDNFENLYNEVERMQTEHTFNSWFKVDVKPFKQALLNTIRKWGNMFKDHLVDNVTSSLTDLGQFIRKADEGLQQTVVEGDYQALVNVMGYLLHVKERQATTDEMFGPLRETIELLKFYDQDIPEEVNVYLQELPEQWNNTKKIAITVKQQVAPLQAAEVVLIRKKIAEFDTRVLYYREVFKKYPFFQYNCPEPYIVLDKVDKDLRKFETEMKNIHESGSLFEVNVPDFKVLKQCRKDLKMLKQLWDYVHIVHTCVDDWKTTPWRKIDVENMDIECKKFAKEIRMLDKEMRGWNTYLGLEATVKNTLTSLKAVGELQNPAIRERHWNQLMKSTKNLAALPPEFTTKIVMDYNTTLADLLELNLHECEEEVKNIVDKAVKEMSMEKILRELNVTWSAMEFEHEIHPRTGCKLLRASEELIETLEDNQVQLQNLITSKFIAHFLEEVSSWQSKLCLADQVITIWFEVQRTWMHLESIFMSSEDIRKQLPEDSARFDQIDTDFKKLTAEMSKIPNVVESTNKPGLLAILEEIQKNLTLCEKALAVYLETKRLSFPRFYFISSADLLDILSNGNQPELVAKHLTKLFDSLARLNFGRDEEGNLNKLIHGMHAKDGEYIDFNETTNCNDAVEVWLNRVQASMRSTIRHLTGEGVLSYEDKPRDQWLFDFPAQASLCGTQIWWTTEVNIAFSRLEEGYDNAIRDYYKKQVSQLSTLISLLLGDLTKQDRQKIMTICTIDVHSRDVVSKLIQMKVESASAFQWVSQLRHRWDEKDKHCFANICDAQFRYSYEYLGNTPRLVITPLTDRCYITLTQSLHLIMGGGPAGPAGTGKTETTKDLGRALGIMVYVFNCSEQMDYKSCGNIYKGLAQTGAWGCFDEFNRISVEVLSVVAVQVKSVLDAIKNKRTHFDFMGDPIALVPTVGIFITMNPGYAGRTELPENLKALFRPCAMVVPDFELICEIMLVAEGFQEAKILARKFITLYTLCKELLSKQDHYDWGLRAIKSVLVVAGSLKRGDPGRPEEEVLMRALRDFNIPKIVTDDTPVFMGLIGDLFPALEVPRKRDAEFERTVKQAAIDLKLQPEDNFILKVVQLEELLEVRHSVFIVGNAGTGKTQVWKTLFKTYINIKRKPVYNDLNPKAVTNDELFGIINPATREWKDGLLSVLMREQANLTGDNPKWIVLDGDIDPMWIESLNTVMDDNKVLTLASNERIALTPGMRLLFEISNLRTATPATVSRAGILYINPQDLGWNPFVTSWIETRTNGTEKSNLIMLFDKYIPICLENVRTRFKKITPVAETSHIEMLCHLLECLLTPNNTPNECPKEWYELYFVFCCVWAFGSAMFQEQATDYRVEFTKWWVNEFKSVKFPSGGTVFDYYIDSESKQFVPWTESLGRFELDPDVPLQAVLVHTAESIRIRYFLDLLMAKRRPVMLVGNAGCGKTVLVSEKLVSLSENYAVTNVPFNFYTTSEMLQKILEKPLEKKAGRNYGPPGNKTLVYFIDDMNMPEVDAYGTVQPHTLIRQHLDYGHWYDRNRLSLKDIHNCQYVSCMNPTAGSFTINPRLQRHFYVFAISFPGSEALSTIYHAILSQHLSNIEHKFPSVVVKLGDNVVSAAVALHHKASQIFLPTAIKFHYIFNLRDISNVFQGLLFSTNDCLNQPTDLVRLWLHESQRVYGDKLIEEKDIDAFNKLQLDLFKKNFEEIDESIVFERPNIYCHFASGIGEPKYMPIAKWETLSKLLTEAMSSYNDLVAAMNLVLFEDAMMHVCRINRILESPRGSALLVGVGGSGKQSLSRLAAFISSLEVSQIQLKKGYGVPDLRNELSSLYLKTGLKNVGIMFLMTDAQVPNEQFLVLINDMLASGEVPDMFPDDEIENIIAGVRNEVKGAGMLDTRENCWKFFIDRVRRQLKVVLCFSPVGSTLRVRSRKFPAIINCTQINWFHEWPQEALVSVSLRFLQELKALPASLLDSVSRFMAYAHTSVNAMSKLYLQNERRYNYTTPKSYLEQINLYSKLLIKKNNELQCKIERLENGLDKLKSTAVQVDELKKKLAIQEVELKEKNEAADALIEIVGIETEKVSIEKRLADEEEEKVAMIAEEVSKKQKDCEEDLLKAEPALIAAQEALNTLNKANLTELKSFGSPPGAVTNVTAAVMVLLAPAAKIPKDRSWKAAKIVMAKVDAFLDSLINYDKENIHPEIIKAIEPYLKDAEFEPEFVRSKSAAAAGLCAWVINIIKFYEVYCDVEPKRKALAAANAELAAAQEKLSGIKKKVASLEEQLAKLTADFEKATTEKLLCQQEADATNATIQLANRLVGGLASENVRWAEAVNNFMEQGTMLPGDVLLVTAFISYVGCFTKQYRLDLLHKMWLPFLKTLDPPIPITENLDPLSLLTDDTQIAKWHNEGLPSDRMSTENATILSNSDRWPLMIDPQLQGIKWIKQKYGDDLKVIRLGQKGYLDVIEKSITSGATVLVENIEESVDPVLDTLLGRNLIKKGRAIKIGDKEIEYNSLFRLILQTKLANPHYKPEMQAQATLINFTVTRDGLEDQLLAEVVKAERPDLEDLKAELTKQQNDFKIMLKTLEDDLLSRLSSAGGNLLGDTTLVENLETTKRTAAEIEQKVSEAKVTSIQIDQAREHYRPAAARASLLYFILNELNTINPIYQFSLKAFSVVFQKAIAKADPAESVTARVNNLIDCISFSVFQYTTRGLFECDKLIFASQMAFQILLMSEEIMAADLDFLLRFPIKPHVTSPVDFLSNTSWGGICSLATKDEFRNLDRDIENSPKRWKKLVESECPEREKFPQEWKSKTALQRLCMMRALRPDRMIYAMMAFIEEKLGSKYVENKTVEFAKSYEETSPSTPIFFILSPGVNPLKDVEDLGEKLGFTSDKQNFHNVSLGQGQEVVAEKAMEIAALHGHWVVLQNIHLVKKWLPLLEKNLERFADGSHSNYRVFMSAEPAATPAAHIIPQGILESSIKITNEPPTGMQANLHKALSNFNQETLEQCGKEAEFKVILFSLCYFHAVVAERRKFGPQGWNKVYPFNVGDLTISVFVLYNYLEANSKVPWEDLRYLFGEIMYGGHITDDWDRRLCNTYLEELLQPDLVDGELMLAPGFPAPPNTDYVGYHNYIDEMMPPESPYLYGLHPNAEIGFLTTTADNLFRTVFEMQPRDAGTSGGTTITREDKVKQIVDEMIEKLPEDFNMTEIMGKVEERTPYVIVAFQECERMNYLTGEIKRSLKELDLGLKGELTITSDMEDLENALFLDQVPPVWSKRAYPSLLGLTSWFVDLLLRIRELETWSTDFVLPASVWLGGFFNPQSLLTAIMQSTARRNELPLDKMCLQCDVTKKQKEEFTSAPREGAYVHGLHMEGARWDVQAGIIMDSKLKELFPSMPVINIRAITQDKQDLRNMYECPVYKTRTRGPTYVWTFNLKTKDKPAKWTLAGVALLLQT